MKKTLSASYFIDFSADGQKIAAGQLGPFDNDDIPMVDYNVRYRAAGLTPPATQPFGIHYTPVTVSIYAFSLMQRINSGQPNTQVDRQMFFRLVDWLVRNIEPISPRAGVWHHHFPIPFGAGVPPPFSSGIAQAQAISLLLRAYQLRPDEAYLAVARQAFESFLVDIEHGGVRSVEDGSTWIEEWPSVPRSHVLNGFMFAILAIHDYMSFFETDASARLWTEVIATLERHLLRFDAGYGSRYDLLRGLVVSETYHRLHIQLLRVIFELSGNPLLREVADRWEGYFHQHGSFKRRALAFKDNVTGNAEYRACKLRQLGHRMGL